MWSPSCRPSLLSKHQTCPSSSSPVPGVFSQHLSGKTKKGACWNQSSVFNIIVTTIKTISIRQNQRAGEEDFSGTREASRKPGGSWNPPLGPNHQGPGVLTKTHAAPEAGFGDCVGLTLSTRVQILCPETPCLLFTSVCLAPWRSPTSEFRVLPWVTCGLSFLHLVTFTWGQEPLNGLLLCILLGENLWRCHINIIVYHRPNL